MAKDYGYSTIGVKREIRDRLKAHCDALGLIVNRSAEAAIDEWLSRQKGIRGKSEKGKSSGVKTGKAKKAAVSA